MADECRWRLWWEQIVLLMQLCVLLYPRLARVVFVSARQVTNLMGAQGVVPVRLERTKLYQEERLVGAVLLVR
jgi:transposase InsO family protein